MSSIGVNAYKNNSSSGCNEQVITVVDARMGRGKSSAAIRYMNENRNRKRFLYITPYIKEVERICESVSYTHLIFSAGLAKINLILFDLVP